MYKLPIDYTKLTPFERREVRLQYIEAQKHFTNMKPIFYTKLPIVYTIVLVIIFLILICITLGLTWFLYDFFLCHRYWLNRRILYKYLKQKDLVFTIKEPLKNIIEYKFDNFDIWIHSKQLGLSLHMEHNNDIIGLFTSNFIEDRMVIKLIRKLQSLKSAQG